MSERDKKPQPSPTSRSRTAADAPCFPQDYVSSRDAFRSRLSAMKARWPDAELDTVTIGSKKDDTTIDVLLAPATERQSRCLFLVSGIHGMEGYYGAAVIQLFLEELAPLVDPKGTTVCLIHAANPWGMVHKRRVNENNVDINRNFIMDWGDEEALRNSGYDQAIHIFEPQGEIRRLFWERVRLVAKALRCLVKPGVSALRDALTLGQTRSPRGFFYRGSSAEASTEYLKKLAYRLLAGMEKGGQLLCLDLHTGFAPRKRTQLFCPRTEERSIRQLAKEFGYPHIVAAASERFFAVSGDMIDYLYDLKAQQFPDVRLFAGGFEAGTLGVGFFAMVRMLQILVLENRLSWFGAASDRIRKKIESGFAALFNPDDAKWRRRALADAGKILRRILNAEGFIRTAEQGH